MEGHVLGDRRAQRRIPQVADTGGPARPPRRASDRAREGRAVWRAEPTLFGDTWQLDGIEWTRFTRWGGSRARVRRADLEVILYGGWDLNGPSGETWSWNGTAGPQIADTGPGPRSGSAMAGTEGAILPSRCVNNVDPGSTRPIASCSATPGSRSAPRGRRCRTSGRPPVGAWWTVPSVGRAGHAVRRRTDLRERREPGPRAWASARHMGGARAAGRPGRDSAGGSDGHLPCVAPKPRREGRVLGAREGRCATEQHDPPGQRSVHHAMPPAGGRPMSCTFVHVAPTSCQVSPNTMRSAGSSPGSTLLTPPKRSIAPSVPAIAPPDRGPGPVSAIWVHAVRSTTTSRRTDRSIPPAVEDNVRVSASNASA